MGLRSAVVSGYNEYMDTRQTLQAHADYWCAYWWRKLIKMYGCKNPADKIRPAVILNNRLKVTAGRAFLYKDPQVIDLSVELLYLYPDEMAQVIIPHELCHLIAFNHYGDDGHGPAWKAVMQSIGLEPNRFHYLDNHFHQVRKMK